MITEFYLRLLYNIVRLTYYICLILSTNMKIINIFSFDFLKNQTISLLLETIRLLISLYVLTYVIYDILLLLNSFHNERSTIY